jgi:hypothetical protein
MIVVDPDYGILIKAEVGDEVWDDLTKTKAKVIRVHHDDFGNTGYWLDNDYLGGGRHPWELSPPDNRSWY